MPQWVFRMISDVLNAMGKAIHGSRTLSLGIAYNKNVDDRKDSPVDGWMKPRRDHDADLVYTEPRVLKFPRIRPKALPRGCCRLLRDRLTALPVTAGSLLVIGAPTVDPVKPSRYSAAGRVE